MTLEIEINVRKCIRDVGAEIRTTGSDADRDEVGTTVVQNSYISTKKISDNLKFSSG